ncbi:MAG: class I SAM-dependent methyltransferase [Pseudanabaenales cyanobacterium]|nr:class I SAM-dependent methyltransferase [Pseudanabaenales cyanobacterium]
MTNLTGVSETLLLTFYARYLESQRVDGIIKDQKSIEIMKNIDFDFSKFSNMQIYQVFHGIRTEILDQATNGFLEKNSDATIINLGAGLCTRFFRVDNGKLDWFGLDLEDVTRFTKNVIGETDRYKYITGSILDFSWMDQFKDKNPKKMLLIAEGLFYYFEEEEVKHQIITIKNKFPGAEMLMEVISPLSIRMSKKPHPSISKAAQFKWGINDLKEIEQWGDGIKLINQFYFFDRYSNRWGWRRFYKYIPVLRNLFRIGHIRFG